MHVGDLGELVQCGELWRFTYARCGHVTQWWRSGNRDQERAAQTVLRMWPDCHQCLHSTRPSPPPEEPQHRPRWPRWPRPWDHKPRASR